MEPYGYSDLGDNSLHRAELIVVAGGAFPPSPVSSSWGGSLLLYPYTASEPPFEADYSTAAVPTAASLFSTALPHPPIHEQRSSCHLTSSVSQWPVEFHSDMACSRSSLQSHSQSQRGQPHPTRTEAASSLTLHLLDSVSSDSGDFGEYGLSPAESDTVTSELDDRNTPRIQPETITATVVLPWMTERHTSHTPPRRRGTHRDIDEKRRQTEAAVLQRLAQLVVPTAQRVTDAKQAKVASKCARTSKLSVLKASVERIEELESLCDSLRVAAAGRSSPLHSTALSPAAKRRCAAPEGEDVSVSSIWSRSSTDDSGDAGIYFDALGTLDVSNTLRQSRLVRENLNHVLIDVATGRVLEVNSHFQAMTGWSRADMVGRSSIDAASASRDTGRPWAGDEMAVGHTRPLALQTMPVEAQQRWVRQRPVQQYPSALRGRMELWMGLRRSLHEHWRVRYADGNAYEILMLMALHTYEEQQMPDGSIRIKPLHVRIMSGHEAPVKLHDF